tara:strand:+ start:135 stop:677 length:543 start_codon:yes stop_codon:yes gene_type:complete
MRERSARPHRAQAAGAGPSKQTQQNGFGLVFAVVRGNHRFVGPKHPGKYREASLARRIFETAGLDAGDFHGVYLTRQSISVAGILNVFGPCCRLSMEPMVNMNDSKLEHLTKHRISSMKQSHGVRTATACNPDPRMRRLATKRIHDGGLHRIAPQRRFYHGKQRVAHHGQLRHAYGVGLS